MDKRETNIASSQVFSLVALSVLGVRLLRLPSRVVGATNTTDGWLATLIAGLIAAGLGYFYTRFCLRFPNLMFGESMLVVYGRVLGQMVAALLVVYLIIVSGQSLGEFTDGVRLILLHRTPPWAIRMGLLLMVAYAVYAGLEAMARLFDMLFIVIFISVIILAGLSFQATEFANILPIMGQGIIPVLRGTVTALPVYMQYSIIGAVVPFTRGRQGIMRMTMLALLFNVTVYSLAMLQTIAAFGPGETVYLSYPVVTLVKEINIPVLLFQRMEIVLMTFWIGLAFASIAASQLLVILTVHRVWHVSQRYRAWLILAALTAVYLISGLPFRLMEDARNWIDAMTIFLGFVFMPLTYVVAIVRHKGSELQRSSGV